MKTTRRQPLTTKHCYLCGDDAVPRKGNIGAPVLCPPCTAKKKRDFNQGDRDNSGNHDIIKITALNWNHIVNDIAKDIYKKGKKLSDYKIVWGKDGIQAFEDIYGPKHNKIINCFGIKHSFDKRKTGYFVVKNI